MVVVAFIVFIMIPVPKHSVAWFDYFEGQKLFGAKYSHSGNIRWSNSKNIFILLSHKVLFHRITYFILVTPLGKRNDCSYYTDEKSEAQIEHRSYLRSHG